MQFIIPNSFVSGLIYYVSESGSFSEVLNTDGQMVRKLLYLRVKDQLIVITESLTVTQFQTDSEGMLSELSKVLLIKTIFYYNFFSCGVCDFTYYFISSYHS